MTVPRQPSPGRGETSPPGPSHGSPQPRLRRSLAELSVALVAVGLTLAFTNHVRNPPAGSADPSRPDTVIAASGLNAASSANPCTRGEIALTFDDGPDVFTEPLLDVLRAYGARATFFVLGAKARARPDLVAAEVADGHRVENHSWDHPHLADLTPEQIRVQLTDTQAAVVGAGAPTPTLLRPPFGSVSPTVETQAAQLGLRIVRWSMDTNDWRGRTPADIETTVLNRLRPGEVILLHDGGRESANTVRALPGIIEGLRARGFCTAVMR